MQTRRNPYTLFAALGEPRRLFIFRYIARNEGVCVSDIAKRCQFSVSAASQQLRILEDAGLVIGTRIGRRVCFKVDTRDVSVCSLTRLIL